MTGSGSMCPKGSELIESKGFETGKPLARIGERQSLKVSLL